MRRNRLLLSLAILAGTLLMLWAIWGADARGQTGPPQIEFSSPPVPGHIQPRPEDLRRQAGQMRDLVNFLREEGKQGDQRKLEVADQLLEDAEQLLRQAEALECDASVPAPAGPAPRHERAALLFGHAQQGPTKGLDGIGWGICDEFRERTFDSPGALEFEGLDNPVPADSGEGLRGLIDMPHSGARPRPLWFSRPAGAVPAPRQMNADSVWERPGAVCAPVPSIAQPKAPSIAQPEAPIVAVPEAAPAPDAFRAVAYPAPGRVVPGAEPDRLLRAAWHLRQGAAELESAGRLEEADTLRGKAERLERHVGPGDLLGSLRREVAGLQQQVIELSRTLEAMRGEVQMLMGRLEPRHRVE